MVTVGNDALLFGGDLEEEGNVLTGWTAVIAQTGRPASPAEVFKVAHHGSKNGDHGEIWTRLLTASPQAVITPWIWGDGALPTKDDLSRISTRSSNIYLASKLSSGRLRRRSPPVDQAIKETVKSITPVRKNPGIVRLRKRAGTSQPWGIELFGSAFKYH